MTSRLALAIAILLPLGGCATILSGRSQEMTINTAPAGADCDIVRLGKGDLVARVKTPQTITLRKTKHDLRITCTKPGYQETTHLVKSEIEGASWGNIILGGGIGWAIDSAGGADNKYARYVNISLPPASSHEDPGPDAAPPSETQAPADPGPPDPMTHS